MREIRRNAVQSAILMAILTMISKVLGFCRELVLAAGFGTSNVVDAYVMAQSIPSIIFSGLIGAVAIIYLPLLTEKHELGGEVEANLFTSQILKVIFIISAVAMIIGILGSDYLVKVFANGFNQETAEMTSSFLKIALIFIFFTSGTGILEKYLNYKNIFLVQIMFGYVQNIIVIGFIIIASLTDPIFLMVGLIVAYVIKFFIFTLYAGKKGYRYTKNREGIAELARTIIKHTIPVFLGSTVSQLNLFVDKILASNLKVGSIAALNYASILYNLIISFSATIVATIVYPKITVACNKGEYDRVNKIVNESLSILAIISIPFSIGAIVYSEVLVKLIFERGAFDSSSTFLTATALRFYSIGILFRAANEILIRIHYAMLDTKNPMKISACATGLNIILNLLLVGKMQHGGLALATSLATALSTVLYFRSLNRHYEKIIINKVFIKIIKIIIASTISIGSSYYVYLKINHIYVNTMGSLLGFIVAIVIVIISYLFLLYLFNINEINLLRKILKKN